MSRKDAVITLDGPAASGKGTIAKELAKLIGFNYLDSGALYRAVALAAMRAGLDASQEVQIAELMKTIDIKLDGSSVFLNTEDVSDEIRSAKVSLATSSIAKLHLVREGLLTLQRKALTQKGLVADGRDMGITVFPNAALKIYLDASLEVRAKRRFNQMKEKENCAEMDLETYTKQLAERDEQDKKRSQSPLKPASDAIIIDNSYMSVEETIKKVLEYWEERKHLV